MALLTAAEAQARGVGVGLDPADLQAIIDAEAAELVRLFGPAYAGDETDPPSYTETVQPRGESLYLRRAIAAVTSVTELRHIGDPVPVVRPATDYYAWAAEGRIQRAPDSLRWGRLCTVVYAPADDTTLRTAVLLELVRIATEQTAEAGGSESVTAPDGSSYRTTAATGSRAGAGGWEAARARQYARMGWLS